MSSAGPEPGRPHLRLIDGYGDVLDLLGRLKTDRRKLWERALEALAEERRRLAAYTTPTITREQRSEWGRKGGLSRQAKARAAKRAKVARDSAPGSPLPAGETFLEAVVRRVTARGGVLLSADTVEIDGSKFTAFVAEREGRRRTVIVCIWEDETHATTPAGTLTDRHTVVRDLLRAVRS